MKRQKKSDVVDILNDAWSIYMVSHKNVIDALNAAYDARFSGNFPIKWGRKRWDGALFTAIELLAETIENKNPDGFYSVTPPSFDMRKSLVRDWCSLHGHGSQQVVDLFNHVILIAKEKNK